jgi:hypothetical protein
MSDTDLLHTEFWDYFETYCTKHGTHLKVKQPTRAQYYLDIKIVNEIVISLTISTQKRRTGCSLYISGEQAKELFQGLFEHKEKIEKEIGLKLEWNISPNKKASRIDIYKQSDIWDKHSWQNEAEWLKVHAELFYDVFGKWLNP